MSLSSANMPDWQYVPGTTYHMTCTVERSGVSLFGMGLEALTSGNQNAGTLVISDNTSTQIKSATVQSVSRKNVVHKLNGGASNNAKAFSFDWQAPASDVGNVTFYFAGVAANGDGQEDVGDYVYTGSQVVTTATNTGMEEGASERVSLSVYPNPVVDVLNIGYVLAAAGEVQVALYDRSGQLVQDLLRVERRPGRHMEMLNGLSSLPAGVYLLRIKLDDRVETRSVLLVGTVK